MSERMTAADGATPEWLTDTLRRAGVLPSGVLRRYHAVLQARGVRGYAWEELLTDYKLAVIDWLLTPVQDRQDGSTRDYWWPKMQCLAGACEDLSCLDLLTE